ncbi:hypothetical protein ADIWIN_2684 [Winogradskyella psychrotolerans RS-3]|uniref:Uncharacterized protein n=1 Tax=Winogradskyella psychrotolerans RS-3 TaxID=641526 RepID=S7X0F9_9FLAO|nr:hypothetical protein ADIWIN_2684 [Winogradskyella psychrotolerans RS-3]
MIIENSTQNFVEDIIAIFIWLANAIRKADKANITDSSKNVI